MGKREYIKAAAAAAVLSAGLALGGMSAAANAVRIGSGGSSGPLGGGTQKQIVDSSQGIGPTVVESTLAQTYHSDYKTYELSVDNRWFFYANVGNGEITDQPVRLEIPGGITYTAEKDGEAYALNASVPVTEYGTYVLTLTMTEDGTRPFSEQRIYKATFRFRIQDKPEETAPAGGLDSFGETAGSGSGSTGSGGMSLDEALAIVSGAGYSVGSGTEEESSAAQGPDDELPPPEEPSEEESLEESGNSEETEGSASAGIMGDDGRVDEETLDAAIDALIGPGYGDGQTGDFSGPTGLESGYDPSTGYYKHTLASGAAFYTNVANGMACTNPVTLLTNDEISFRALKDGTEAAYTVGTPITEPGSYVFFPSQDTSVYASTYYGRTEPVFTFRILGSVVRDLGVYDAPEGAEITGVTCNGEEADPSWLHGSWAYLGEDGQYTVELETEAGPEQVSFLRDTAAPVFQVQTTKSEALITYADSDAVTCEVMRGKELVHSGALVGAVAEPGSYTLTVYDAAGNHRSASFKLSYRMNTGAIVAVLLVLVLILAGVIFVRNISRQMRVR